MNLMPRRFTPGPDWEARLRKDYGPAQPGSIFKYAGGSRPDSIWCMMLPMSSYWAPRAAFWWVSNERKP